MAKSLPFYFLFWQKTAVVWAAPATTTTSILSPPTSSRYADSSLILQQQLLHETPLNTFSTTTSASTLTQSIPSQYKKQQQQYQRSQQMAKTWTPPDGRTDDSTLHRYLVAQQPGSTDMLRPRQIPPRYQTESDIFKRQQSVIRSPSPRSSPQRASTSGNQSTTRKGGRFRPNWLDQFAWLQHDIQNNIM